MKKLVLSCLLVTGNPLSSHALRSAFVRQSRPGQLLYATSDSLTVATAASGLYRPVAEEVWDRIQQAFPSLQIPASLSSSLTSNEAPAKGMPGAVVRMETRALLGEKEQSLSPIRYARLALLETVPAETSRERKDTTVVHTAGIQVLNLVIFPNQRSNLPVWGADFVSLPGNKHLLLLDAQPMTTDKALYESHWNGWYTQQNIAELFPWGGDMPEPVQPYVSSHALWTRFVESNEAENADTATETTQVDPLSRIQGPLTTAVMKHLDIYLELLASVGDNDMPRENHQPSYIEYRVANDPARPMLKALFGEEWTERVLHEVLFPQ